MTAENISMFAHISDVRVRGLRAHDARARDPLPAPEGAAPLQPRPPQVLRQATLQVQQQQFCQHAAAVQLLTRDIHRLDNLDILYTFGTLDRQNIKQVKDSDET